MMKPEKFFATIDAVKPGRFDCKLDEIGAIVKRHSDKGYDIAYTAFLYGFLKGQRAAEAKAKKEEVPNG